ncbi:hypothetical protein BOX15_Mlig027033g1 [Macrostomum lignano]|uniref:Uncharacterized protein n=2 Tax=Macrostomum lignano TaxID=282301 RepID=A0A267H678_9PLAT|nr:hypothetical protein BOX15_Mlig027033g3 [Macrostomum lignano]PAA92989.1 hypothetical protein BOX15_Mlig027033g2 [Macrostomum lignano]PAA93027.1 hypothetical protein BOX15_Mlig027033g1 [Macrostomum lignano]
MHQLHVPASVSCPGELNPVPQMAPVPFAPALQRVRENRQLAQVHKALTSGLNPLDDVFSWMDQDNNSAISGKLAEQSKLTASKFNFMYFRIRIPDYRAVLNSLVQVAKSESLFSEEKLRKWTLGYRFRLQKGAPIKAALRAFSCRLGIESDSDIVFCRDGFFGDPAAGTLSSPTGIPHQMLLGDVTAVGCGLTNGSSIFVSKSTPMEREAAAAVLRVIDEEPAGGEEGEGGAGSPSGEGSSTSPSPSASETVNE